MENSYPEINTIAVIGNYLPRKCGIATFTSDLVQSLAARNQECITLAMNDKPAGYNYPPEVHFEINQDELSDYQTAADYLNTKEVDVVSLQHEFGIFGGASGEYILSLLEELKMPVVTTLHTVVTDPSRKQVEVMKSLAELTDRFVVMSKTAIEILHTLYDIPRHQVDFIPHGIPDMPFEDPNYYKDKFDLLGRKVLLTFGLLSQNKGIEYVIKGLPKVVERFPEFTYIVLGATHPNVLKTEGENYRGELERLVKKLKLENNVIFKNNFVPFDKLCEYLSATDIYITPYVQAEQITSGTLAYAAGTGKAIISTPYWYAKEMLSDGRGRIVPFKDENAIADAIIELCENEAMCHKMRKRSYDYNRNSTWKEVALQYVTLFNEIKSERLASPRPHRFVNEDESYSAKNSNFNLPRFNISHLEMMTDSTGILQHSAYTVSDRNHGYCTDDNARALIVAIKAQQIAGITGVEDERLKKLAGTYLGFLMHAFNPETGRFRNFMSYSRLWLEDAGSEDSHGRALWSLGVTASLAKHNSVISLASNLFMSALPAAESFKSPRAVAFTILGIESYLENYSGDSTARRIYSVLADRLYNLYKFNISDDWLWPEDILAYSNGKLPHALILAGERFGHDDMLETGLKSLKWLMEIQQDTDHLVPIGNYGWYKRDSKKARFDQQPLEANALIEALLAAYKIEKKNYWIDQVMLCFSWYLGNNDLNLQLYDPETGGCRDGLQIDSVNQNEGAESTLAWLLSLIAMYQLPGDDNYSIPANVRNRVKLNSAKRVN